MKSKFAQTPVTGRARAIVDGVLDRNIQKRAYAKGMNLSRYLEALDPSSAHKNARGDAFNRVLRSCGLRTKSIPEAGMRAATLEEVVKHPKARHLAIELFARAYRSVAFNGTRASIAANDAIPGNFMAQYTFPAPRDILLRPAIPIAELVGQTTGINSAYYKPFYLSDVQQATSRVGESAEIPAVRIATSEKVINLVKYGRRLDVTYEALRRIPIDLLSFYIQRIAITVEAEKVDTIMGVLVSGDGNAGTAATSYNLTALDSGTTANNLTIKAWLAFKMLFVNPLMMTTVMAQDSSILKLMLLNSNSANIPLVMYGGLLAGQGVTPINQGLADGIRAGWVASAPANKLVGFDKRLAVERVFEIGAVLQEESKDVKSQINSLVLSEVEGYGIIDPKATKVMNLAA